MASPKESSEAFRELLKEKGLKYTYERKVIFDEISQIKKHFDADSLYTTLKGKGFRVSRDTVYRTIPLLLECTFIQKSVGEGRRDYFERTGVKGHHDHMVCISCGEIIEFHSEKIEKVQQEICDEFEFDLIFHDHRLFGHCKLCLKRRR
jgi:Fur family transcriptional regulator, ferric uptake regulator